MVWNSARTICWNKTKYNTLTQRLLKKICELGVPIWHVWRIVFQRVDHIPQGWQGLVDILGFFHPGAFWSTLWNPLTTGQIHQVKFAWRVKQIGSESMKESTNWLTDELNNRLTNRQTDRPTDRPIDQRTNQRTNQPTDRPTNRQTYRPTNGPIGRPTNQRRTDRPTDRQTNQRTNWPTYRPTDRPTNQPNELIDISKESL